MKPQKAIEFTKDGFFLHFCNGYSVKCIPVKSGGMDVSKFKTDTEEVIEQKIIHSSDVYIRFLTGALLMLPSKKNKLNE